MSKGAPRQQQGKEQEQESEKGEDVKETKRKDTETEHIEEKIAVVTQSIRKSSYIKNRFELILTHHNRT